MDVDEMNVLISRLEKGRIPNGEVAYRSTLESWVSDLMDEIHRDHDAEKKMELVALEYRARIILGRWKTLRAN